MHIGGDDAALDGAFVGALGGAIGKVGGGGLVCIAIATRERAEGLRGGAKDGGAQVVFKTGQRLGEVRGNSSVGGFGSHLADGTVLHAGRGGIEQADAVDDAAGGAEGLAQDLQASTNGKDRAAGVGGAAQAAIGNQVVRG